MSWSPSLTRMVAGTSRMLSDFFCAVTMISPEPSAPAPSSLADCAASAAWAAWVCASASRAMPAARIAVCLFINPPCDASIVRVSSREARPGFGRAHPGPAPRSEEHTSELQSLMRISYAVFCLKKKKKKHYKKINTEQENMYYDK